MTLIAGAIKNIIAIGAGIVEGWELGDSKAALITRGFETCELIKKAGGDHIPPLVLLELQIWLN